MTELLIATCNKGKVREIRGLLKEFDFKVTSLDDYPDLPKIIEDGKSFSANAIKKAEMFRSTRPWRAALNERRGDYLSLCRSGGIRGWIVKAGSKPYYLVDQEMPCLSDG